MNKFKIGDKVKVKENFWEIESDIDATDNRKKLAGRTLEVKFVFNDGDVYTKQDDSNDDTRWAWDKNWLELYTEPRKEITWETLKRKDVVFDVNGNERMVLDVRNDLVFISQDDSFYKASNFNYHRQELSDYGYTIKQATPEKLELTLEQVAEKFGVDVTNIKIKK